MHEDSHMLLHRIRVTERDIGMLANVLLSTIFLWDWKNNLNTVSEHNCMVIQWCLFKGQEHVGLVIK